MVKLIKTVFKNQGTIVFIERLITLTYNGKEIWTRIKRDRNDLWANIIHLKSKYIEFSRLCSTEN
jgi:hypothetical protein